MFDGWGPKPKVITVGNGRYLVSTIQTYVSAETLMTRGEEYETVVFDCKSGGSVEEEHRQSWGDVIAFRSEMKEKYGE